MKEKIIEDLIDFVMTNADKHYSDDFPIDKIEVWIRDFFEIMAKLDNLHNHTE